MPIHQDNDLSYQKLTWNLFKECLFQPLFYGPAAAGIFLGFIDQPVLALGAFLASTISLSYYFLLGKAPRKRIQQQIEDQIQHNDEERTRLDQESREELHQKLDERGRSHFENLIKLEQILDEKITNLGNQLVVNQLMQMSREVTFESIKSLKSRITYKSLLEQFDVQKLQQDLNETKSKYEDEKDINLKREYRQTIQALTNELNQLKKLETAMEQLEQDIITAQSSLRGTILLVSQPQSADHTSRLEQQVAKLRDEVEVAKKVNQELADFGINPQVKA
ncbi:TPA: hypothetical protein EYN98_27335 [Candidatus Poribacteria bacterium]|jgi:hypothetical protein|nr:hypothetical protein [Candidatus Poribacteria bacterium]HIB90839.1 hypothetical protein [Candidatus Poribacteria bacterium]HIC02253.1 hypothetical protein [Candidatus Poribacteria bacterium]HIN28760.1 hypothetical protein [Candidatus Poribacteria bacterium]HIO08961.1 hypothetical protein [Candidatus Poribacteria bacterium]